MTHVVLSPLHLDIYACEKPWVVRAGTSFVLFSAVFCRTQCSPNPYKGAGIGDLVGTQTATGTKGLVTGIRVLSKEKC